MVQVVNALSTRANIKQEPAKQQTASTSDFKAVLSRQSSQLVQETISSPVQERIALEKQIAESVSLEGMRDIPEAVKKIVREWMADGKMPSFEELAAFLGISVEQLQRSIKKLSEQLTALINAEKVAATIQPLNVLTGIDANEWGKVTDELFLQLSDSSGMNGTNETTEKTPIEELLPSAEKAEEIEVDHLLQAIQLLAAVPQQEWVKLDEKTVQTVMQAGKLWGLFGEHADMNVKEVPLQTVLKDMMKDIADKLGRLLSQPQSDSRAAILQKAFHNFLQPAAAGPRLKLANNTETFLQGAAAEQTAPPSAPGKETTVQLQPFFHPLGRTEAFSMTVQTTPRPMNMEQFMEKFSQILGNSNLMKLPNGAKLLLRLYPEQLGSLRIELLQQNGVMTAKILSSTSMVKDLLEQNMSSLKHAFNQQSISVDKIELTYNQAEPQKFDRQQQQQSRQQQPQAQAETTETDDQPAEDFKDLLINMEV
ncbi:flagellar hook-length control protein FliK [Bacillus aerolatus]|nr:flagellar hook-length control protein FliK [Bacillus aerolatus]